ncbi:hypothetical protein ABQF34_13410 [Mycolicibacterium boenickei]
MTPSTVGLVLVEGCEADGATVDHDAFDIRGHSSSRTGEICDEVVAAIRRTEQVAAERGRSLTTIGVTWSSGAGAEATVLLDKLAEAGIAEVVPVRLRQATDALACRIAGIVGFETTGVCVLEPDVVQAMTVGGDNPVDNPVQTTVSRGIETVAGLTEWLSGMFDTVEPRPDGLVVVGSAVDLDSVLPKLEKALAVPVFTPAEPGLPLARGAALAAARRGRRSFGEDRGASAGWRWPVTHAVPLTVLVGGVVAFAVSLTLAIGQHLEPGGEPNHHRTTRPVVSTAGDSATVPHTPPVAVPPPPLPAEAPSLEPVEQAVEPEFIVDESGTLPVEDTGMPSAPVDPMMPGLEPVPAELQSPLPQPDPAAPPPELAQQAVPVEQAPPAPPAESVPPPPVPEAAPPPPPPAPEPPPPPPAPEPPPPAPEVAPPVPESPAPVPVAP